MLALRNCGSDQPRPDVAAHVTLHLDLLEYRDFSALKKFASKYVKVMKGMVESRKRQCPDQPVRFLEAQDHDDDHSHDDDHNNDHNNDHNIDPGRTGDVWTRPRRVETRAGKP